MRLLLFIRVIVKHANIDCQKHQKKPVLLFLILKKCKSVLKKRTALVCTESAIGWVQGRAFGLVSIQVFFCMPHVSAN